MTFLLLAVSVCTLSESQLTYANLDEEGILLLFDLSTEADGPRHCCTLSYEYGGVSEICWLGADFLAVGTTRGKIITFSIGNDNVSAQMQES